MPAQDTETEPTVRELPGVLSLAAFRHLLDRAPCFLPALAVLGAALGGYGWCLVVLAVLAALRAGRWRMALMAVVCVAIVFLRVVQQDSASREIASSLVETGSVTVQGTVVRQLSRGAIVDTGTGGTRVAVYGDAPLLCGDEVELTGSARETAPPLVPGMFDPRSWMLGQGVCAQLDLVRYRVTGHSFSWASLAGASRGVRKALERILMPEGTEADPRRQVLCALVLGDKEGAEAGTLSEFQRGGCMHAFAVSGLHVGLVAGILLLVLRLLRVRPWVARYVLLVGVAAYVWVTGMAVPALRAYLMLAAVLGGRILVRQVSLLNIWCFAGLVLLLIEPWQAYQSGFQLSFAVYAAICVGVRLCMRESPWFGPDPYIPYRIRTESETRWRTAETWVRGAVLVSVCAWIGSLPLTYGHFHAFNTYGVLTNIAITPVLPVVMAAGLLSLCCSIVPGLCWVADAIALKASGILIAVVSFFAGLPASYIPACEPRAPQEAALLQLRYGDTVCMLGNPGLLIDCGGERDARYTVQPFLFHDGFTPAALLETRQLATRTGGEGLIRSFWPEVKVLQVPPGQRTSFHNDAGKFRIYGAPADISPTPAANTCPIVVWESPRGLVVYLGDASLATLEGVPEDLSGASCAILGHNNGQIIDAASLTQRMPGAAVILLPSALEAGLRPADFAPLYVRKMDADSPLLRLETPGPK